MLNLIQCSTGAQPRLKSWGGSRFGSQQRPGWVLAAGGVAPCRCEDPGYHPRKIFENSDAKSCILVTTCCEFFLLFENYGQEVLAGTNTLLVPQPKSWGPVSPGLYGCCAYDVATVACYQI